MSTMPIPVWVFVIIGLFAAILVPGLIYALCGTCRKRRAQPSPRQDLEANRPQHHRRNKAGPRPLPRKPQQAYHGQRVRHHQRQTQNPRPPLKVETNVPPSNFHKMPGAQKEYSFNTRTHHQRSQITSSPPSRDDMVSPMTVMNPITDERNRQGRTRTRNRSVQGHRAESRSGVRHQPRSGRSLPRAPVKVNVDPERIYAEIRLVDKVDGDGVGRGLRRKR